MLPSDEFKNSHCLDCTRRQGLIKNNRMEEFSPTRLMLANYALERIGESRQFAISNSFK